MNIASRAIASRQAGYTRTRDAWTAFWNDPGQSRCVAGAASLWQILGNHWSAFARSMTAGARVVDLGCGAGAVARLLVAARHDLQVTGIDFARIPFALYPRFELLSDTPMETLPFADRSLGAAVSQFGFEYSEIEIAARELARVLAPGAKLSFLVHHAGSSIVATNRSRLDVLVTFLGPSMRTAFCGGDGPALQAQLATLLAKHPRDELSVELARSLPSRLTRTPGERAAIWRALEDALAPERCLAESLHARCVASDELEEWSGPLRRLFRLEPVSALREPNGDAIAWRIEGSLGPAVP